MLPQNGIKLVSLVSFAGASSPDSPALGDNLSKYNSAALEMVVCAVCSEPVSASIACLTGKKQGFSRFWHK